MRRKLTFLIVIAIMAVSVSASPVSETVGSPTSINPLSGRILPTGPEAAYFNPSLLPLTKGTLSAGMFLFVQDLYISYMERPTGVDVTNYNDDLYNAQIVGPDGRLHSLRFRPLPTSELPNERGSHNPSHNQVYSTLGATLHLYKEMVTAGLYMMMPVNKAQEQKSFFPDEREANFSNSLHYELYEDRMMTHNLAMALGVRPLSWLSLGMGATLVSVAQVNSDVYVPDGAKNENKIIVDSSIEMKPVFHGGLYVSPLEELSFALTFHPEVKNKVSNVTKMTFWNLDEKNQEIIGTNTLSIAHGYKPMILGLGSSYKLDLIDDFDLTLAFSLTYEQWSNYLNRQNMHPEDRDDVWNDEKINIDGRAGDWDSETYSSMEWSDTLNATIGVQGLWGENSAGLDLAYIPSPVPNQEGRTNYVDNDRVALALGYERDFSFAGLDFALGGAFQSHLLLERETYKYSDKENPVFDEWPDSKNYMTGEDINASRGLQTNNPGFPGFTSKGMLYTAGFWLKIYLYKKEGDDA